MKSGNSFNLTKRAVACMILGERLVLRRLFPGITNTCLKVGNEYMVTGIRGVGTAGNIVDFDICLQDKTGNSARLPIEAFPACFSQSQY